VFEFKKENKIQSRLEIESLYEKGSKLKAFPIKLIYLLEPESGSKLKSAFAVPKRSFKLAVNRNKIKRRMREAFRLNKGIIEDKFEDRLLLMFVVQGSESPSFQEIQDKIILLLQRLKERELSVSEKV